MRKYRRLSSLSIGLILMLAAGCDRKQKSAEVKDLPDLNALLTKNNLKSVTLGKPSELTTPVCTAVAGRGGL